MTNNSLGVAIFGGGRWGKHLIRNVSQHPSATLVAVIDPKRDRLEQLAQTLGLSPDTALVNDWREGMALPGVEAVVIATPASTHHELIRTALEQGHHVLAEKPLTLDYDQALDLCQLAEQRQRLLVIDHTYLFNPAVQQGKAAVQQGLPGQIRYGYAARTHLGPVRQDVDVLWDLAIHDIAIFNHWLGAAPTHVQAQGTIWLQSHRQIPPLFPDGLADLVWFRLFYPNGVQCVVHLCWCNPDKQRRLCLVGDRGTLIFDELNKTAPLTFQQGGLARDDAFYTPTDQQLQVFPVEPAEPLRQVCDHFLDCIERNIPSAISDGWLGASLVQTLIALSQSLKQQGALVAISLKAKDSPHD
jgi:predicted dehydrogenase